MKKYNVNVNGFAYEVEIEAADHHGWSLNQNTSVGQGTPAVPAPSVTAAPAASAAPVSAGGATINAPMQGKIIAVKVGQGEAVVSGQVVAVLEAMKMENEIVASEAGTVAAVQVSEGQSVDAGDVLIAL